MIIIAAAVMLQMWAKVVVKVLAALRSLFISAALRIRRLRRDPDSWLLLLGMQCFFGTSSLEGLESVSDLGQAILGNQAFRLYVLEVCRQTPGFFRSHRLEIFLGVCG